MHELTIAEVAYLAYFAEGAEFTSIRFAMIMTARLNGANYGDRAHGGWDGYITAKQANVEARAELLVVNPGVLTPTSIAAVFFAEEVRRELSERYGEAGNFTRAVLSVRTTLDPKIQLMARKAAMPMAWCATMQRPMAGKWRLAPKTIDISQDWGGPCWPTSRPMATSSLGSWRWRSTWATPPCGFGIKPERDKSWRRSSPTARPAR